MIRYPNITVELLGHDGNAFAGNAFAVLGEVRHALKANNVSDDEIALFIDEATSGNYQHLLATTGKWVNIK